MPFTLDKFRSSHLVRITGMVLLSATLALIGMDKPVLADPPPWAPAHGYRNKHRQGQEVVVVQEAPAPVTTAYVVPPAVSVPPAISTGRCDTSSFNAGTVVGGIVGGAIGSRIGEGKGKVAATIGGALLGMMVGSSIGTSTGSENQRCAAQALEYGQERQAVAWHNPDNGAEYQVVPQRTYQTSQGQYCREYTSRANVGGQIQEVYGTACRQPDGSWQIVK